jgi:hypothetical protein
LTVDQWVRYGCDDPFRSQVFAGLAAISALSRSEGSRVNEEELISFIRAHIGSIYTLELLLLMKRHRDRMWHVDDLVRELRSSRTAVGEALVRLTQAGLISEKTEGHYAFAPGSERHAQMAEEIARAYASTPLAVVKAIIASPDHKLRAFSDAFKLKE